ncbi:MAG: hypothetical protein ACRD6N_09940, partial [Pyrinomonadaceae bacterium]
MKNSFAARGYFLKVVIVCLVVLLAGCVQRGSEKPTPEAAKQLLKLRGYEFDQKSFSAAAAAGDLMALNAFLAAGMNPNAADEN